jgi:hypothetical protein
VPNALNMAEIHVISMLRMLGNVAAHRSFGERRARREACK